MRSSPRPDASGTSCRTRERGWRTRVGGQSRTRALVSGTVVGRGSMPGRQGLAGSLFHAALPRGELQEPASVGVRAARIDEYLRAFRGDTKVQAMQERLALRLVDVYDRTTTPRALVRGEPYLRQRAPLAAMLVSGACLGNPRMIEIGLARSRGSSPCSAERTAASRRSGPTVSCTSGEKAAFDQQPVEACGMVSASVEAARRTGDNSWLVLARKQFACSRPQRS